MTRTMRATEVVRNFRAALDAVIRTGETIRIERHGEIVAELRAAQPAPDANPMAELSRLLAEYGREDPGFADEVEATHAEWNAESMRDLRAEAETRG